MRARTLPAAGSPRGEAGEAGAAGPGLEIRLFGPMEVRLGSRPLPRLRSRKGLWLLALLALRAGRRVERDWLAAVLWPECDAAHGRRSLRQTLFDLRGGLGPEAARVESEGLRAVRLELAGAWVDALAFDAALARGEPESLAEAVRLYRGPLLEDCPEEWVLPERVTREQAYLGVLQALARQAEARGEPAAAVRWLRQAVAMEPFGEAAHRALMEALVAA